MRKLFFVVLIMAAASRVFSQDEKAVSCDLSSVITVDGLVDEWPMNWEVSDDKKFSYNVCTDENNIYVRMMTKDDMIKRKIALFGMTVWIDANGKKKRKLGLKFPTGVEANERADAYMAANKDRKDMTAVERDLAQKEITRKFILDIEVMELIGLSDKPLTSTRSGITNGIKVAIANGAEESYGYELIIPFKSYRLSKASISTLAIGFETGKYVPPPVKNNNPGSQYGGGGMSGSGMGMGGYGGNNNYARRGSYQSNPMGSSSSTWTFIKLK